MNDWSSAMVFIQRWP